MATQTILSTLATPTQLNTLKLTSVPSITNIYEQRADAGMQMDVEPDLIRNSLVQICFCLLYATVFVLGVFGNVLVCYVVLRNRAMQTVTNIFITNLALSDILLCALAVPFTPLYTFMGRWAFGTTLCHLVSFAQGCSVYISTLTLTSIAIDRYFVIIYPFHPRMKLSTCIAIIVSIWVISVLATLPYGMYMKVVTDTAGTLTPQQHFNTTNSSTEYAQHNISGLSTVATSIMTSNGTSALLDNNSTEHYWEQIFYCEENWPSEQYRKVFGAVTCLLQFGLPFIIISICYTWVSVKLNARARAKPGSKSSQREEADRDRKKRTNRMLIAMVAVFGLSWMPLNAVNIFNDFYEESNEWRFYTFLFFVAHSIAMSSTCYNPFLYAWLNENFRKEFKHVLPCFNPSNNNVGQMRGALQRSDRNQSVQQRQQQQQQYQQQQQQQQQQALPAGSTQVHSSCVIQDLCNDTGNGLTIETQVRLPREQAVILARENGNSSSVASTPRAGVELTQRHVNIVLNDSNNHLRAHTKLLADKYTDEAFNDSADEHTSEIRFSETPFVSSDNATGISMLESSFGVVSGDDRYGGGGISD